MTNNTLRDQISKLNNEKLIEILNIENTEYTDEAIKIVQEELISRGFTEAYIDKGKESFTFRDLIYQVKYEDVQRILRKEFNVNKEIDEKLSKVFTQLLTTVPSQIDNINIIVDKHYDELTNTTSDWDVCGYENDSEEKFSVDLYYWNDWLSFNVKSENLNRVGKELFVACCLLKMTIHGFSAEEIENRVSDIISNPDEVNCSNYSVEGSEEDTFEVHPWLRFWARNMDLMLFAILLGYLLSFAPASVLKLIGRIQYIMPVSLLLWVLVEAILLSTWGTTPGKIIFGITIRDNNGNKPSFRSSLNRSASVWFWGMGCGINYVEVITEILSYKKLKDKGITRWDQNGKYNITHEGISIINIIIAVVLLIGIPILRYHKLV